MLTSSQLALLKADIQANHAADWAAARVNLIADLYNVLASPSLYVWRTDISAAEIKRVVVWTELISASQGQRDVFRILVNEGTINAADANIRAAFGNIFAPGSTLTALGTLSMRKASLAEKALAIGAGTLANPATLVFEGNITGSDVIAAMGSGA